MCFSLMNNFSVYMHEALFFRNAWSLFLLYLPYVKKLPRASLLSGNDRWVQIALTEMHHRKLCSCHEITAPAFMDCRLSCVADLQCCCCCVAVLLWCCAADCRAAAAAVWHSLLQHSRLDIVGYRYNLLNHPSGSSHCVLQPVDYSCTAAGRLFHSLIVGALSAETPLLHSISCRHAPWSKLYNSSCHYIYSCIMMFINSSSSCVKCPIYFCYCLIFGFLQRNWNHYFVIRDSRERASMSFHTCGPNEAMVVSGWFVSSSLVLYRTSY